MSAVLWVFAVYGALKAFDAWDNWMRQNNPMWDWN